jgi:N-methylhydantoinase B
MKKAEEKLINLLDKYGVDTVKCCIEEIIRRSEKAMRDTIRKIPEGTYDGESGTDWDGTVDKPVFIRVDITVKHRPEPHLIVDFGRSDKQVSFVNMPLGQLYAATFAGLFFVLGRGKIPRNEGSYRPVEIKVKEGTVACPRYPATVGSTGCILSDQVINAVWHALGKAIPEDAPAWWTAHCNPLFVGSDARKIDPRTGWHPQLFVGGFWSDGGSGGVCGYDGWNATNLVIVAGASGRGSIEWAEIRAPIRIWRYELNPDSEGAGKWRGCFGTHVEYEVTADAGPNTLFCATGNSDGELFPALGQAGGLPGKITVGKLIRNGKEVELPYGHFTVNIFPVQKGDRILTWTGGGGGWGNPLERDIEAVRQDVLNELVSIERARDVYGVVIDPKTLQVDYEATKKLRAQKLR